MEDCAPPPAGALPCFRFPEWEKPAGQIWDDRCTAILVECGETRSNSDIVDLIEARIGMRLCKVGCLPDDRELAADLTAVEYGYNAADALQLERKDDMRRRRLASPDDGDALALTFAYPASRRNFEEERRIEEKLQRLRRRVV